MKVWLCNIEIYVHESFTPEMGEGVLNEMIACSNFAIHIRNTYQIYFDIMKFISFRGKLIMSKGKRRITYYQVLDSADL